MAKTRDRNHVYLYTVDIIDRKSDKIDGQWKSERVQVEACNIQQAAVKLNAKIDDVLYVTKVIL
jgi:hypothetical protein